MYKVVLTETALEDLRKLGKNNRKRILTKIKEYSGLPFKHFRKLVNPKIGMYRLRVGNYRVVVDLEDNTIVVLRIGHRSNIYR